ncbi:hypothetical protein M8C21_000117, partial [Ambrosia artemisiifolia]
KTLNRVEQHTSTECEYRHSDIARVNPTDCWYWLNGNCLNPKCAFRHPPIDGLLEAEVPIPVGPAVPQAPVKQGVACIFFQKGFCLKGHLCPFWHGSPNIVNNKAVHPVPPNDNPVTKPSKRASAGPEKSVQEQKFTPQENVQKPTEFSPQGAVMEKKVAPPPEEPPRYTNQLVLSCHLSNHDVYDSNHVGGLRMQRRKAHYNQRHDCCLDSGPLSNRLRGRIKIPGRAMNMVQGIKGRSNDDFNNDGRDYGGYRGNDREFNGSKRLSNLKSQQIDDGQTLWKRKYPRTESQQLENKVSFEGPKLTRKSQQSREYNANNQNEIQGAQSGNRVKADYENDVANKVGSIDEDAMLDQELEAYDHRDGDYDYEQIDGEDFNLEEGEEYMEEGYETGKKQSESELIL